MRLADAIHGDGDGFVLAGIGHDFGGDGYRQRFDGNAHGGDVAIHAARLRAHADGKGFRVRQRGSWDGYGFFRRLRPSAISAGRFVLEGVFVGYAIFVLHIVCEGEGVAVARGNRVLAAGEHGGGGLHGEGANLADLRPSASAVLIRHAHRVLARLAQRLERIGRAADFQGDVAVCVAQGVGHLNVVVLFAAQVHGQALRVFRQVIDDEFELRALCAHGNLVRGQSVAGEGTLDDEGHIQGSRAHHRGVRRVLHHHEGNLTGSHIRDGEFHGLAQVGEELRGRAMRHADGNHARIQVRSGDAHRRGAVGIQQRFFHSEGTFRQRLHANGHIYGGGLAHHGGFAAALAGFDGDGVALAVRKIAAGDGDVGASDGRMLLAVDLHDVVRRTSDFAPSDRQRFASFVLDLRARGDCGNRGRDLDGGRKGFNLFSIRGEEHLDGGERRITSGFNGECRFDFYGAVFGLKLRWLKFGIRE